MYQNIKLNNFDIGKMTLAPEFLTSSLSNTLWMTGCWNYEWNLDWILHHWAWNKGRISHSLNIITIRFEQVQLLRIFVERKFNKKCHALDLVIMTARHSKFRIFVIRFPITNRTWKVYSWHIICEIVLKYKESKRCCKFSNSCCHKINITPMLLHPIRDFLLWLSFIYSFS
jgi:hypothetical protein